MENQKWMKNEFCLVYHPHYDNSAKDNPYRVYSREDYQANDGNNTFPYVLCYEGTYQECTAEEFRLMDERYETEMSHLPSVGKIDPAKNRKRR